MLQNIKNIYDWLPKEHLRFLKHIPDRVLFGNSYRQWKAKVSFDKSQIDQNLYDTLKYARENTEFGRDYIPDKFDVQEARNIEESLPFITSADLSANLDYYTSDQFNKLNSYTTTTGGSGRNPTKILLSDELYGIEWAHVHHIWSFAGYDKKKDVKLTLRGKSLKGDRLVEYNPIYNELVVDSFKVNKSNFKQLVAEIKKYDIKYIHGYPSLVKEYMTYFEEYACTPKLNGILLTSEGADAFDKKMIGDFFSAKVISFYGQTERAGLAVDIDANGLYRVYTSYGHPRVIEGELSLTSFVNRALPLINYKIGDGAELIEDEHHLYIKDIASRWGKDFVYLSIEKRVSTTALNLHTLAQSEILYYQIHQSEFAKIEIRILPKITSSISSANIVKIFTKEMQEKLKDFEINVKIVNEDKILKSHRGKVILLVQELKV